MFSSLPRLNAERQCAQHAVWRVLLREEYLFGRSLRRPSVLRPPLQQAQLTILKLARRTPLQKLEHGLAFQYGVDSTAPAVGDSPESALISPQTSLNRCKHWSIRLTLIT